jgi:hypothetical protein
LMKSALWKVTRSTRPASASRVGDAVAGFMRESSNCPTASVRDPHSFGKSLHKINGP